VFTTVEQFILLWEQELTQTARLFERLTNDALSQPVVPGHRTLGDLVWHVITAMKEIVGKTGLEFEGPEKTAAQPIAARDLLDAYVQTARSLARAVSQSWTDAGLAEPHDVYDMTWDKATILLVTLHHQIHHRGQITVLMRQAGLKLPAIYGPSADES
jgi:uncharacterized damage-inducible protein DinB